MAGDFIVGSSDQGCAGATTAALSMSTY
jgi:hypothetical protein